MVSPARIATTPTPPASTRCCVSLAKGRGRDKSGRVKLIQSGVNPDIDCYVDSEPLSIKTVSFTSGIRLKWTSNAVKAKEFIDNYKPISNLLVIRVLWGETGTIRFIPLDVQLRIFRQIGAVRYLDYRGKTNTRGVNLSPEAEQLFNQNSRITSLPILWEKPKTIINPVRKWIDYWRAPG